MGVGGVGGESCGSGSFVPEIYTHIYFFAFFNHSESDTSVTLGINVVLKDWLTDFSKYTHMFPGCVTSFYCIYIQNNISM